MTRRWQPKYPVHCEKCGWKGQRTEATLRRYACPRCYPGYRGREHRRIRYDDIKLTVCLTPRQIDQGATRIIRNQQARTGTAAGGAEAGA